MTEHEYLDKLERLDEETRQRFHIMFGDIFIQFRQLSYSKAELFLEHLKRMLKKDCTISGLMWEVEPTV